MKEQEIFDFAVQGIFKQGGPSYIRYHATFVGCRYRGLNGRKCIVGLFLPDDLYFPEMEGEWLFDHEWFIKNNINKFLLNDLRDIHDRLVEELAEKFKESEILDQEFLVKFREKCIKLAEEWELSDSALKNI